MAGRGMGERRKGSFHFGPPARDEDLNNKLYVGGLDTRGQLMKIFSKHGNVKHINFLWHYGGPRRGEPRGYCFIEFTTHADAVHVQDETYNVGVCMNMPVQKTLDGMRINNRPMAVKFATDRATVDEAEAPFKKGARRPDASRPGEQSAEVMKGVKPSPIAREGRILAIKRKLTLMKEEKKAEEALRERLQAEEKGTKVESGGNGEKQNVVTKKEDREVEIEGKKQKKL